MIINHNMGAINAQRNMGINSGAAAKSMEKLSSGLKINRAGDDAAGLSISEKMRAQIRGLNQASTNAEDGISMIQTAEGALTETHSILQRMRELAVQSANDTNTDTDRGEIQKEISQLKSEVNRISTDTEFNKKPLLNGTLGTKIDMDTTKTDVLTNGAVNGIDYNGGLGAEEWTLAGNADGSYTLTGGTSGDVYKSNIVTAGKDGVLDFGGKVQIKVNNSIANDALNNLKITVTGTQATLQIGANKDQNTSISIGNMNAATLGVNDVDVSSQDEANDAIGTIETAIQRVSAERSKLGAVQNRLEHTINNLGTSSENLTAAESRIRDTDMAAEMSEYSKNNILQQAAQAMLAQAKSAPEGVLQLLR